MISKALYWVTHSKGSFRWPPISSKDPSLLYCPESVSYTTLPRLCCQCKHSQNAISQPTWKQNTWAPHKPEKKYLPSFKIFCSPLDFTASQPGGSFLSAMLGRHMGWRGDFSPWGIMKRVTVPSKQNFNCNQRNKSNLVLQHTSEITALGGCKRDRTSGNFWG